MCKFQSCLKNPAEKAVVCKECGQLFCENHTVDLKKCPNPKCGVEPFQNMSETNPVQCKYCNKLIYKDAFKDHNSKDCTKVPHCYFNGCNDRVQTKEAALKHISEKHSEIIWNNFNNEGITFVSKVIVIVRSISAQAGRVPIQ